MFDNEIMKLNGNIELLQKDFIKYLDVREKTVETYRIALNQFFKWLKNNNIKQPTREDIIDYRDGLKEHLKPASIQGYLIALRQFFKWTNSVGIYPNITDNVKGVKIDTMHKKDALTIEQAKELVNSITNLRDKSILSLMLTCGLRTIEIERANINDLQIIENNKVLFIQGKGHDEKSELVKISDEVYEMIINYLSKRNDNCNALFVSNSPVTHGTRLSTRSIRGMVKEYLRDINLDSPRLSAHSLRHTAGTIALMTGSKLEEVQQMLRHKKLDTTMIYLHHLNRMNNNSELNISNAIFK